MDRRGYRSRGFGGRHRDEMPRRRRQRDEGELPARSEPRQPRTLYCKLKVTGLPDAFSEDEVIVCRFIFEESFE